MDVVHVGACFSSFAALEEAIQEYGRLTYSCFWKSETKSISSNIGKVKNLESASADLKYYRVKYSCKFGGRPFRKRTIDGSRQTKTFKQSCPVYIRVLLTTDKKYLKITHMVTGHNHAVTKELYELIPQGTASKMIELKKSLPKTKLPDIASRTVRNRRLLSFRKPTVPTMGHPLLNTSKINSPAKKSSPKKLGIQKQPITVLNMSHNQEIPQDQFMHPPQQETSHIITLQDIDNLVNQYNLANQSMNVSEKVFLVQENYGQNGVEEVIASTPVILATDTTDDKVTGSRTDNAIEGLVREKKRSNDLKEKLLEESRKRNKYLEALLKINCQHYNQSFAELMQD